MRSSKLKNLILGSVALLSTGLAVWAVSLGEAQEWETADARTGTLVTGGPVNIPLVTGKPTLLVVSEFGGPAFESRATAYAYLTKTNFALSFNGQQGDMNLAGADGNQVRGQLLRPAAGSVRVFVVLEDPLGEFNVEVVYASTGAVQLVNGLLKPVVWTIIY